MEYEQLTSHAERRLGVPESSAVEGIATSLLTILPLLRDGLWLGTPARSTLDG